jgi:hypothetical protein
MSPVNLELKVKGAVLVSGMDGEDTWFTLRLACSPTQESGVLEIGDRYVFAATHNRPILDKRKSCNFQVSVQRISFLSQEKIAMIGLSASKIGNLYFVPPVEKELFWPSQPAALDATVFVCDELFERLVSAFQAGKGINWLELSIEKPGILEYGREPDGSRITWKLESTTDQSCVDVESIDVGIGLFEGRIRSLLWLAIPFVLAFVIVLLIRK